MSKQTARNALVVIGMWTIARVVAWLLNALIIVIHTRGMTFTGDVGNVMMWLWEGFPDDIVAALAAITLVWVIETRKPTASVGGLAALYLYSGGLNAWQILSMDGTNLRERPTTSGFFCRRSSRRWHVFLLAFGGRVVPPRQPLSPRNWRKIAITLTDPDSGEQKAQACENA